MGRSLGGGPGLRCQRPPAALRPGSARLPRGCGGGQGGPRLYQVTTGGNPPSALRGGAAATPGDEGVVPAPHRRCRRRGATGERHQAAVARCSQPRSSPPRPPRRVRCRGAGSAPVQRPLSAAERSEAPAAAGGRGGGHRPRKMAEPGAARSYPRATGRG